MGYVGIPPTAAPLTSADLEDNIVTAAKLATDAVETAKVKDLNVTVAKLPATVDISTKTVTLPASVAGLGTGITNAQLAGSIDVTSKITGTVPAANLGSGTASSATILYGDQTYKTEPTTNLAPLQQDIVTLGLKQSINENNTKFNLPNSAITHYEADADWDAAGSTDALRNASEYLWAAAETSVIQAFGTPDANCMAYMDWDTATTTVTGQEAVANWATASTGGSGVVLSTSEKKFGASSLYVPSGGYMNYPITGGTFNGSYSGDWTMEYWYKMTARTNYGCMIAKAPHTNNNFDWRMYLGNSTGTTQTMYNDVNFASGEENMNGGAAADTSAWSHYAMVRDGTTARFYSNGVQKQTATGFSGILQADTGTMRIGATYISSGTGEASGYYDDMRFSDSCRYPDGTTFVPNQVTTIEATATGTALGTTNVPTSPVTNVSGVVLLKDAYGVTTLGSDVKVYFTANNSVWTEASSYADAGTFSTGIKMIKLGKTTCTEGSDVRWKVVWANQEASVKEAQIHGFGINY